MKTKFELWVNEGLFKSQDFAGEFATFQEAIEAIALENLDINKVQIIETDPFGELIQILVPDQIKLKYVFVGLNDN